MGIQANRPILTQRLFYISHENVRKRMVFRCYQGGIEMENWAKIFN